MKRPWYLMLLLILMTLGTIIGIPVVIQGFSTSQIDIFKIFTLVWILYSAAVVMLWMWKKWGFYLILLTCLILIINGGLFSMAMGGPNVIIFLVGALGFGLPVILGVLLLYLAMKPVWKNFK